MRLDRFLAESGLGTRSEVKKILRQGVVLVNGEVVKFADFAVDEARDKVLAFGNEVIYRKFIYLMLNKPQGYISATRDGKTPTVLELVPEEYQHFEPFPVGRLDIDTEGLLLLTNDGEWAHSMTSPKKEVYKKYFAILDKPMEEVDIEVFKQGIEFKEYTTKPATLEITDNPCEVYISICEGKFHQVKKMCAYVGKNVVYLKRISIGDIVLDETLEKGGVKEINY